MTPPPRCPQCGVLLPLHAAGCLETPAPVEKQPDSLPGRPGYEVTQRSRFAETEHDDCDCAACRPWTS
jgi:hypothetical protein